ncbi:hypothetical protein CBM2605_B140002 [Cupriavidus neocaledonicus]|uniref:Transposase n=1 Tax=Cupriavidus neocaledonicus TaxID=1040979 RepID=A0ABY1V8T4_9BURK|nr:hypothetical protein CBM2605_B140002 [Cupriavidus neocaledonicus]
MAEASRRLAADTFLADGSRWFLDAISCERPSYSGREQNFHVLPAQRRSDVGGAQARAEVDHSAGRRDSKALSPLMDEADQFHRYP